MNDSIKELIEKHINEIQENNFINIYEDTPLVYANQLTDVFIASGINPLIGLDQVPYQYAMGLKNITSVNIPDNIKYIGGKAFLNCQNLTSVYMSDSINIIAYQAFSNCTNLKTINLSQTLQSIGSNTFYNCKSLREIELPKSLVKLHPYVFASCSNNLKITYPGTVEEFNNNVEIDLNSKGSNPRKIICTDGEATIW